MRGAGNGLALSYSLRGPIARLLSSAFRLRFESPRGWPLRLLLCNWFAGCQAVETRGAALLICGRGERRRVAGERSRRPRWRGERLREGLYVAWRCLLSLSSLASGRCSAAECNWRQYGSHERHHRALLAPKWRILCATFQSSGFSARRSARESFSPSNTCCALACALCF